MTRKERFKKWMKDHTEELTVAGFYTAAIAGLGFLAYKAVQAQNEQQQKLEQAISRGDTILPNPDGSWWIISTNETVRI